MNTKDLKFARVECQICLMEDMPAAIMLIPCLDDKTQENKDAFYLEDFAIDCPLACGYQASKKFSNLHICTDCAAHFFQRGEDMYHRPLLGVWPVIDVVDTAYTKPVMDYYRQVVKRVFLSDKDMGHGLPLMFAATESVSAYPWGQTPEWQALVKTMLKGLSVSMVMHQNMDNSDVSSPNVPFIKALEFVIQRKNFKYFNDKPAAMQYFLIRMGRRLNLIDEHLQFSLERIIVMSEIVGKIRKMLPTQLDAVHQEIISKCHDTNHGIPVRDTFHHFHVGPMETVPDLALLLATMESTKTRIDPGTWTELWCRIILQKHLFSKLSKSELMFGLSELDPYLASVMCHDVLVYKSISDKLIPNFKALDPTHNGLPPFYLNLGEFSCTDPLQCICGFKFTTIEEAKSLVHMNLIAEAVRRRRREHFENVYGNEVPDKKSGHYLLHSTVAAVVHQAANDTADEKTDMEALVFSKLAATAGRKGDVFRSEVVHDVRSMIRDFQEFLKTEPNQNREFPATIIRSVEFKVFCAAKKRGWISADRKFGVSSKK